MVIGVLGVKWHRTLGPIQGLCLRLPCERVFPHKASHIGLIICRSPGCLEPLAWALLLQPEAGQPEALPKACDVLSVERWS